MDFNIKYIPNNWFKKSIIELENPNYDAHDLCLNGYLFKRHRINKKSINWLCKSTNCSGSVTLSKKTDNVESYIEHEFVLKHDKFTEVEETVNKFKTNLKIRCESEPTISAGQIFLDEQNKIAKTSGLSYEELAKVLPAYSSIKPTLAKRKKKGCPKLPKSLRELSLTEEYCQTSNKQKFLILNNKNKILVFASPTQLEALAKATHWYADGTFRTAAKHFYQLYIIHAYVNQHMIPCCFALMNRRRKREYNIVLRALKKEAKVHNFKLKPKHIMTDFELASINAFKENFLNIETKGCLFHFCQSLMKKLNSLGLKAEYQNNDDLVKWFTSVCCLAIMPEEQIDSQFEKILSSQPIQSKLNGFLDYLVDTYFEGSFPPKMWNHFNTNGTPRTNNNLEGYNLKLNKHLSVAHPDIFKSIAKLKEEEVDSSLKYFRALKYDKPPVRNKLYVIKDTILLQNKQMLIDNDISLETYLKYSIKCFDFSKLEKKLKDSKSLVESDAESISDCSDSSSDGEDDDVFVDELSDN